MTDMKNRAATLAAKCADAFSYNRYGSWPAVAAALLDMGFTYAQAEGIMRSRLMRWAADNSTARYGHVSAKAIVTWLNAEKRRQGVKAFTRDIASLAEFDSVKCHACGSDKIAGNTWPKMEAEEISQEIACVDCGAKRTEIYKLYQVIDEHEIVLWDAE